MNIKIYLFLFILLAASCNQSTGPAQQPGLISADSKIEATTDSYLSERQAFFGDLHIHSGWSFDAFIYNVRTDPGDAYSYARGIPIKSPAGTIKIKRPLDFASVTDHSEYLGVMMQMINPESPLYQLDIASKVRSPDRAQSIAAFGEVGTSIASNVPLDQLYDPSIMSTTWEKAVEIADDHYEPGVFTTFPGYEWTSSPRFGDDPENLYAANLHRNVIYRGNKVSSIPFSSFDSQDPEELWKWMEGEKSKGIDLIAIPHNANMSDGLMFPKETFSGRPIDRNYAQLRHDNEPLQEVVQVKGQSMSHPLLQTNDEFANFEIYAFTFAIGAPPPSRPEGSYVREAFGTGLQMGEQFGVNPYKFGIIGSSDTHNSGGTIEEDNYSGKFGGLDGTPGQRLASDSADAVVRFKYMSAAGLAGVWAEENTREAIYKALKRKETFATSGTRLQLRFFGGSDFRDLDFEDSDWVKKAYTQGVPMGGDLRDFNEAPAFLIWVAKDPDGANLDRVQIIKAWIDQNGNPAERTYDVLWSEDRELDTNGDLPPVGSTVNVPDASYTNSIGAVSLQGIWKDVDFDPAVPALYFVRVLEIPTPRWSTFDAKELGIEIPNTLDATIQERAWSSPIWYHPN